MPSFTSNSKMGFVLLATLAAVTFIAVYAAVIGIYFPLGGDATNHWQGNVVNAQDYLFSKDEPEIVIVGSSRSYLLNKEYFGEGYFNLAMVGGSTLTGIEIIVRSKRHPKIVLVEVNDKIMRPADNKFIDRLFTPVMYQLSTKLPFLQEKNQPACIFSKIIKSHFGFSRKERIADRVNTKVYESNLKMHLNDAAVLPDQLKFDQSLNTLGYAIDKLALHGIPVVLFSPPIAMELERSRKYSYIRTRLHKRFPKGKYLWAGEVTDQEFQTNDGIHLVETSAVLYSHILQYEVKKLQKGMGKTMN